MTSHRLRALLSFENVLNLLLVAGPAALVLERLHASEMTVFVLSCLAIVPLAGWMGKATEHLAHRVGEGLGGLLNATFGNAAELIIALMALRAGLLDVVKASIAGSIIGNVLLVFGLAALVGGARKQGMTFNKTAASLGSTLLFLATVGLVVPAAFHHLGPAAALDFAGREHTLSVAIAAILMICYVLSLVFTLKTHRHLYTAGDHDDGDRDGPLWSRARALAVLLAATFGVALMSELLVKTVGHAAETLGMTEVFVGVILVAVIGNAAEHSTAILVARKGKGDLAINIAVGSSLQIALFVAPVLVFASYLFGSPLDLVFTPLEVVAVCLSAFILGMIAQDGEANWMEGVQLLAVYVILGLAFYWLPEKASG